MKEIEAIKFLHKRYKEIENMSDEELLKEAIKIMENSPQEILSVGSPTVTFVPEIVYCRDCIHRPERNYKYKFFFAEGPLIEGKEDTTCPYVCDDSYYTRIPEDDFYCKFGEAHE